MSCSWLITGESGSNGLTSFLVLSILFVSLTIASEAHPKFGKMLPLQHDANFIPLHRPPNSRLLEQYMLRDTVRPSLYNLSLYTFLRGYNGESVSRVRGVAEIWFSCQETVPFGLELHAVGISFLLPRTFLYLVHEASNKNPVTIVGMGQNNARQTVTFLTKKDLQPGNYIFHVEFDSFVTQSYELGLQEKVFRNVSTEDVRIGLVTIGEPTFTRYWLPCFDEPAYKANWLINIVHPVGTSAVSNMEIISSAPYSDDSYISTQFAESPPMASYYVTFVVAEVVYIHRRALNLTLGLLVEKEKASVAENHIDMVALIYKHLQNVIGVPLPLRKLDHIEVRDFVGKGLENWGLIQYNESVLSHSPPNVLVIAHEIAHQWFGNLISLKWWSDLWLNEGFATYYGTQVQQEVSDRESHSYGLYAVMHQRTALFTTERSSEDTRIYSTPVVTPDDAILMFRKSNQWLSQKSSYIIGMFRETLGTDKWRAVMKKFLTRYFYQNVDTEDFIRFVTGESGMNQVLFADFLRTWLYQRGFPWIEVSINASHALLYQRNFEEKSQFSIPIFYNSNEGKRRMEMMWKHQKMMTFPFSSGVPLFNTEAVGYYRVFYDREIYHQILNYIKEGRLAELEVSVICDDAYEAIRKFRGFKVPVQFLESCEALSRSKTI